MTSNPIYLINSLCRWLGPLILLCLLTPPLAVNQKIALPTPPLQHDDRLQSDADALLPLFDAMPPVPVSLSDEPILKSGTTLESGVAYTNCDPNHSPAITVKTAFFQKANRLQLGNILKHELTHAWLCRRGRMSGHDESFRQKFKEVGGWGN